MGNDINTQLIKSYISKNKLSLNQFSKLCKISRNTLQKILNNKKNIKLSSIFKIVKVMKVELHEIFI